MVIITSVKVLLIFKQHELHICLESLKISHINWMEEAVKNEQGLMEKHSLLIPQLHWR